MTLGSGKEGKCRFFLEISGLVVFVHVINFVGTRELINK